jgi:NAD(P)-dependent dehydrogenase (short-subunit alcohol dehydrogenase family)
LGAREQTAMTRQEALDASRGSVVVSGASRGVGRAVAMLLAERGYRVFAGVLTDAEAAAWSSDAVRAGGLVPVILDITKSTDIEALAARLALEKPLRALVSVAGLAQMDAIEHLDAAQARRMFDVNVFGALALTQALLPRLKHDQARLIFVSSMAARVPAPLLGCYAASKSALEAWVDALRIELRPWGVRVALVEPGGIRTAMTDDSVEHLRRAATRSVAEGAGSLPYAAAYRAAADMIARDFSRYLAPEQVAKVLADLVDAKRLPARRLLGADAKATLLLHWLPSRWLDGLMASQFKLTKASTARNGTLP